MAKSEPFVQSVTTKLVCDLFEGIPLRDSKNISWQELEKATGRSRPALGGSIATAKRRMLVHHEIVIENERNIGYRMRIDGEISESGEQAIERARRVQKTGLKKMKCADRAVLSAPERIKHDLVSSVLELSLVSSRPRTMKNVEQMVLRSHNVLSETEQLEAIRQGLERR